MSLSDDRARFSTLAAHLILFANSQRNMRVRIDSVKRSEEEQRQLVEAGASQTMNSSHLDGLAIDLIMDVRIGERWVWNEHDTQRYKVLGDFWEILDDCCYWGGYWETFKDYGHFYYASSELV